MPSPPVAVDAWGGRACYPRSTFYPLSDGDSTFHRRITKPDFRLCSTCRSHSQLALYLYALCAITDRAEGTFGRLRYSLGGDRPSQTTHQTGSLARVHGPRLGNQISQGGVNLEIPPLLHCYSNLDPVNPGQGQCQVGSLTGAVAS